MRENTFYSFISHILAFEGDSQVRWFDGNYAMYEKDRKQRLGIEADRSHRIKHKAMIDNRVRCVVLVKRHGLSPALRMYPVVSVVLRSRRRFPGDR